MLTFPASSGSPAVCSAVGRHFVCYAPWGYAEINVFESCLVAFAGFGIRKGNNDFQRVSVQCFGDFEHERKRQFQTAFSVLADAALAHAPMRGQCVV